ncbi:hypothetical protein ACP70R_004909 [Stipagrostis hirtigluma subsp. patula]
MAGGGDVVRSRAQARGRRRRRQATPLPLDVVLAIAARSDAATLVRCAATCADVRSRVADDPAFGGRLRLRRTDRFVLPLLRGHLVERRAGRREESGLYLVDTTTAGAPRLRRVPGAVPSGAAGEPMRLESVTLRDGLLLLRMAETEAWTYRLRRELRVRDLATGRSLTLPPEPEFPGHGTALVVDGAAHWLCENCVVKLNVRSARATVTTLPASFPGETWASRLLAMSSDGNLMVLVMDGKKISAWEQSKHTLIWKKQPWVVIEVEEILRFNNVVGLIEKQPYSPLGVRLIWFAERSGAVLIGTGYHGFFWLDLQSKKIVRWLDPQTTSKFYATYCPIETDLSSWVPTFSSTI